MWGATISVFSTGYFTGENTGAIIVPILATIFPQASHADLLAMQESLEDVHVAGVTERYIVDLVQATRTDHRVALGASPRGTLALLKLARALAALQRRDFVLPDDVKAMAVPALAHRLVLKPELWAARVSAAQVVQSLLTQVPAPGPDVR